MRSYILEREELLDHYDVKNLKNIISDNNYSIEKEKQLWLRYVLSLIAHLNYLQLKKLEDGA